MKMQRWGTARPDRAMNIILYSGGRKAVNFARYPGPPDPDGPDVEEDEEFIILQSGTKLHPPLSTLWCELPENIDWVTPSTDKKHERDELEEKIKKFKEERQENRDKIQILREKRGIYRCRTRFIDASIAALEASQNIIDEEIKIINIVRERNQQ